MNFFCTKKMFSPTHVHNYLHIEPRSTRDVNRISTKLKYLCGAYTLQSNRAVYNKTEVSPTCQLCGEGDEDLEHFILNCSYLEYTRNPIISEIEREIDSLLGKLCFQEMCVQKKIGVILDCTILFEEKTVNLNIDQLSNLEYHTRRLLHNLSGV